MAAAATHHQQQQLSSSGSTYDVFLSFYGKDVRRSFADHLYHTLRDAGIKTFRDNEELKPGEGIAPELQAAIQQSIISIPIFSTSYGSSKWCLNELNEIYECKITGKQTVFPIFYKIEPRDVRHQTGSYAKAFNEEHPQSFDPKTVQKWQHVLKEIGSLKGWHFTEETYEGKYLREVVKEVLSTLNKRPKLVSHELVGIESHKKKMLELLDVECRVTKIVGICGFGGMGKTTIARVVCEEVLSRFDAYAFVENVRHDDGKFGIVYLQNKLIKSILKGGSLDIVDENNGINEIQQRLNKKRILVVLDDVDQDNQVTSLIGGGEWFATGSKIIITTRNRAILSALKEHDIYTPELMNLDDSLELFSHYAFKMNQLQEDYLAISKEIVKTTKGLPLALRVIGSSLFARPKASWESMLKKLQKVPNNDVMKSLKISYNGLEDVEQEMFLDIACFFIGWKRDIVCHIWEACESYPQVSLENLHAKSLITINEDGELRMHDVLRDLGRDIVRQENKKPEKRSRIWSEEEVLDVLFKQKEKIKCSGLTIDFKKSNIDSKSESRRGCLLSSRLDAMIGPRLLQLDHAQISDNCVNSFSELRWLSWKGCPEQYALTNFCPEKLVVLDLSFSEITENWKGWNHIKEAVNLKVLELESCKQLHSAPDLSKNRLLELISFSSCTNLVGIDTSISSLTSLVTLDLSGCKSLVGLPTEIGSLTSLVTLDLSGCKSLVGLPTEIGSLTSLVTLDLSKCKSLVGLPTEIGSLTSLVTLDLSWCKSLVGLPTEIGSFTSLVTLNLRWCESMVDLPTEIGSLTSLITLDLCGYESMVDLPTEIGSLTSLVTLDLRWCESMVDLPTEIGSLTSLVTLYLSGCKSLVGLPIEIGSLTSLVTLDLSECTSLVGLPTEIGSLTSLVTLNLSWCSSMMALPTKIGSLTSLVNLYLIGCESLVGLPTEIGSLTSLVTLDLSGCKSMVDFPTEIGSLTSLVTLSLRCYKNMVYLPTEIGFLTSLVTLHLSECKSLVGLPTEIGSLKSLVTLDLSLCKSLVGLPTEIGSLTSLVTLHLSGCKRLVGLPTEIGSLTSLVTLYLSECKSLVGLPTEIGSLKSLVTLNLSKCESLVSLPTEIGSLKSLVTLDLSWCKSLVGPY